MLDEHQLITQLKAGSHEAFTAIYNMYARRLYSFVLAYAGACSEAEDIVQDTFIRLWQSRESIRQTSGLKPLLFTISRNQIITAFRRRVNKPAFEDITVCSDTAETAGTHSLEYQDLRRSVQKALDSLPQRQREIIRLSRQEGLKNHEIAQRLGLSEQTVKNQLSLGLKAVKAMLSRVPVILTELMMLLM